MVYTLDLKSSAFSINVRVVCIELLFMMEFFTFLDTLFSFNITFEIFAVYIVLSLSYGVLYSSSSELAFPLLLNSLALRYSECNFLHLPPSPLQTSLSLDSYLKIVEFHAVKTDKSKLTRLFLIGQKIFIRKFWNWFLDPVSKIQFVQNLTWVNK